jgi:hypothetical protein
VCMLDWRPPIIRPVERVVDTDPKPQSEPSQSPLLRPPQFGLRTLLAMVTVCGALLALLQWLPPAAVALLAFLVISIFCHVAGNAIGTRLREIGDRGDRAAKSRVIAAPKRHEFAPVTQLSRRQGLGWLILVATSVGITSGAIGGGLWTFLSSRGQAALAEIAIGVIAFAVLGGLATFAIFSFAQVLWGAYWQALAGSGSAPAVDSVPEPTPAGPCPDAFWS